MRQWRQWKKFLQIRGTLSQPKMHHLQKLAEHWSRNKVSVRRAAHVQPLRQAQATAFQRKADSIMHFL
jgi:hypothetical protein